MVRVPKKNISQRIEDVKARFIGPAERPAAAEQEVKPETFEEVFGSAPTTPDGGSLITGWPRRRRGSGHAYRQAGGQARRRFSLIITVAVVILVGCVITFNVLSARSRLASAARVGVAEFGAALNDLRHFQFMGAGERIAAGSNRVDQSLSNASNFPADLWPLLKSVGTGYQSLTQFSSQTFGLLQEIALLEANWYPFVFGGRGGELTQSLERVRGNLAALLEVSNQFQTSSPLFAGLAPLPPADYVALKLEAGRVKNLLDALIPWLKEDRDHHLLVLFGNSSELRPGGGFIGSYADVVIRGGSVASMEIHDVNDADRTFDRNIVPPKPLQAIVKRWRAADANWFFDFADSARKVSEFVEASRLYDDQGTTFDGVLGISPKVVADLLGVTGPVDLGDSGTITSANVLAELQRDVQAGQALGARDPKRVLAELAPAIGAKLAALTDDERTAVLELAMQWVAERDLVVYFRLPTFQSFAAAYGATATVFESTQGTSGDYIAVVSANVGGNKSDFAIDEKVVFQSQIGADGTASDHVTVTRAHRAKPTDEWWYRGANDDYLRIFAPPGAQLTNASGGAARQVTAPLNYAAQGYERDPDLVGIESTATTDPAYPTLTQFEESGKSVFATWVKTLRGAASTFSLDYTVRLAETPAIGSSYQFVFEKQPGASGRYEFQVSAPSGFRFKENGLPVYYFATTEPPGRLVVDLTFEKAT